MSESIGISARMICVRHIERGRTSGKEPARA